MNSRESLLTKNKNQGKFLNFKLVGMFATNSNYLIPISLWPDCITLNILFISFILFDLTELSLKYQRSITLSLICQIVIETNCLLG